MAELQEAAGMGVYAVELTPDTLVPAARGRGGDEKLHAHLAELPEGLRALAGEVRELAVRSTRLAVVPVWVEELTRLEALEVSSSRCRRASGSWGRSSSSRSRGWTGWRYCQMPWSD